MASDLSLPGRQILPGGQLKITEVVTPSNETKQSACLPANTINS